MKLEKIFFKKELFALILRKKNQFKKYGVDFFTNNNNLLQVGLIKHKKNHQIKAHKHIKKIRKINYCTEVLIIKKGEIKIRFYNNNGINIKKDKTLRKEDIIILFKGGHGFLTKEKLEMIEVKQGPYIENSDKILI
jgi:mannose-6-phosphate isomerase-like protein (cupin superfamily)